MSKEYSCVHFNQGKCKRFSDGNVTSWCVQGPCEYETPSNADRIRTMSDEELSDFLCHRMDCAVCMYAATSGCTLDEWLQQPAEEVDGYEV